MRYTYKSMLPAILLAGCISTEQQNPKLDESDLKAITALMVRTFTATNSTPEDNITDARTQIHSEELNGFWFYSQINTGKNNKVYRQRVNHLDFSEDCERISLTTYKLNSPDSFIDAWENPQKLNGLSRSDITLYLNDGCQQNWTKRNETTWVGYVDSATCVIDSARRNTQIRIESGAIINSSHLKTSERGFKLDGTFLWGSQTGEFLTLSAMK